MSVQSLSVESFSRGEDRYEEVRRAVVWNARVPDRFPDLIVRPRDEAQVVEAVRYAVEADMKLAVRSGGHSWSGSFMRDGGMLLDLSQLDEISIDVEGRVAQVGPGAKGGQLMEQLEPQGLMFPTGHLPSVGLGGFLLQGGFGWNARDWGLGAENVIAIDAVTAEGELVHADAESHSDLYWAARGAGPGFFAVVTRFYLRLHPARKVMTSTYLFPLDALEDLLRWRERVQPQLARFLETSMFIGRDQMGHPGTTIVLEGDTLAESEEEARRSLEPLAEVAASVGAVEAFPCVSCTLLELLARFDAVAFETGLRYTVDNMWTSASTDELLPGIRAIADAMPPSPSNLYLLFWGPLRELPDMAFSMQADLWLSFYAVSNDPAVDESHARLVSERMKAMEALAPGIQLGDENLISRPFPFMATANFARLEAIRYSYDPERRFHSYLGIPTYPNG
jgi:FAD/FMN-containing dehydrogenase